MRRLPRSGPSALSKPATLARYRALRVIARLEVWSLQDADVCDACQAHDGRIVPLFALDAERRVPPFHERCRCRIVPVLEP